MKLLTLVFLMLIAGCLHAQRNLYDLSLVSSSGEVINMSFYKGKKLLIVVASLETLQGKFSVHYWGKIQSFHPDIELLILPYRQGIDSSSGPVVKQFTGLNHTRIGMPIDAKKDAVAQQWPLLQWLTQEGKNQHFNKKLVGDGQLYVISGSGVLYAVLEKGVSESFLNMVLAETDVWH